MKVKIGVVGYGYWGPNLVRNLASHPQCASLTVCETDERKRDLVQSRFQAGNVNVTADFQDILDDGEIRGVVIATPISTHFELAKKALENGKHVFVEKPLAHEGVLAHELVELAKERNLKLMVGHTFLFSPPVLKAKEILKNGDLGNVYYIDSQRVNLGLHQKDVSVIWDLGPHDLSIILFWLDDVPAEVSAKGRACVLPNIPDVCFITLKFASEVIANVTVSWLSPTKLRRTIIVGDRKMLIYDDTEVNEKIKVFDKGVNYHDPETFGEYHLSYRSGDVWSPHLDSYEPLNAEMTHFIECIQSGQTPRSDGMIGWQVVRVLEAAERSLNNGGEVVHLK